MALDRFAEIKKRRAEIKVLQQPLEDEDNALYAETETLQTQAVREIVPQYKWELEYDNEYKYIFLTPLDDDPEYNMTKEIADRISKHTNGGWHDSFDLQDDDECDYFDIPKLSIDDGEVRISFNNIKSYRTNTLGLDVDESGLHVILDTLRKNLAYVEGLLGEN